jgi:WD40 repeat protein
MPPPSSKTRLIWSSPLELSGVGLTGSGHPGARLGSRGGTGSRNAPGARPRSPDNSSILQTATGQALTPPLVHQGDVHAIAWRADGAQLVTASEDHTARIWDISGDPGTVADWRAIADRGAYRLDPEGAVVGRDGAASRR